MKKIKIPRVYNGCAEDIIGAKLTSKLEDEIYMYHIVAYYKIKNLYISPIYTQIRLDAMRSGIKNYIW